MIAKPRSPYRYPWNIITSSFLAPSLLDLVFAIAVLLGAAQAAEPIYGPTEFFKLIAVAATACGSTSFLLQYAWFFFHLSASALFAEHAGFYGVQGALFVAIKHVMPGQDVTLLPGVALQTRFLPGIYILLMSVISLVTGNLTGLRFAVVGTFAGWLYLRFFKPSGLDGAGLPSQPVSPNTYRDQSSHKSGSLPAACVWYSGTHASPCRNTRCRPSPPSTAEAPPRTAGSSCIPPCRATASTSIGHTTTLPLLTCLPLKSVSVISNGLLRHMHIGRTAGSATTHPPLQGTRSNAHVKTCLPVKAQWHAVYSPTTRTPGSAAVCGSLSEQRPRTASQS